MTERHILWIEGVDFERTLFDSSDLSTLRGASLTLLAAPEHFKTLLGKEAAVRSVKAVFTGASQGAFEIEGETKAIEGAVAAALAALGKTGENPETVRERTRETDREGKGDPAESAPFAHMRFVHGLAPVAGNAERALDAAWAKARFAQFTEAETGIRPTGSAEGFCPIDRRRAADAAIWVPSDAFPSGGAADVDAADLGYVDDETPKEPENKKLNVSRSVAARRHYGRWARQGFYARELGRPVKELGYDFVDSLHEMVARNDGKEIDAGPDTPRLEGSLPLSLRNKIAVFYADGNGFGKIRDKIAESAGGRIEGLRHFSRELKALQREDLLAPLLCELSAFGRGGGLPAHERASWYDKRQHVWRLRIETLLWGGDEVMWAVPAWLGWWLARKFFRLTRNWNIDGQPLTFAAGLVFCSYKTPVRDATALAKALADIAKVRCKRTDPPINALEVDVLESVDPPQEGIEALRRRLLGLPTTEKNPEMGAALAIPAGEIESYCAKLFKLKGVVPGADGGMELGDPALPLSQIFRILGATHRGDGGLYGQGEQALKEFKTYLERGGTERAPDLDKSWLALTEGTGAPSFTALNLHRISQLWDYIGPFPGDPLAESSGSTDKGTGP